MTLSQFSQICVEIKRLIRRIYRQRGNTKGTTKWNTANRS